MFIAQIQTTKQFFTALFILVSFFNASSAHMQAKQKPNKTASPEQKCLYRKFNTGKFFQGLANSCVQVGTAINAQTENEKKQAACNVLASVFQTAAVISEKTQKTRSLSQTDQLTPVSMIINFLRSLPDQEREQLLSPSCPYLHVISSMQKQSDKEIFITKTLENKDEGIALLHEIFSLFKAITLEQLPTVFDALQEKIDEKICQD